MHRIMFRNSNQQMTIRMGSNAQTYVSRDLCLLKTNMTKMSLILDSKDLCYQKRCTCLSLSLFGTHVIPVGSTLAIHEICWNERGSGRIEGALTKCFLIILHSFFFQLASLPPSLHPPPLPFCLSSASPSPSALCTCLLPLASFSFFSFSAHLFSHFLFERGRVESYHGNSKLATSYLFAGFTEKGRAKEKQRVFFHSVSIFPIFIK